MVYELPGTVSEVVGPIIQVAEAWRERAWSVRAATVEDGLRPAELLSELAEAGYAALLVPEEHGGLDAGSLALAVATEGLTAAGLPPQMWPLTHAVTTVVALLGTTEQQQRFLPRVAAGELWFGLAFTEANAGHEFREMTTTLTHAGDTIVVQGEKTSISGADVADHLLVVGRFDDGDFGAILVDPETPGLQRTELPMGGREGVRQWRLTFDDVAVPDDLLVGGGPVDMALLQMGLTTERIVFLAAGVGAADHALTRAVEWARERTVFGERPIGAFQAIAHPLADVKAGLQAAQLHLHRTAHRIDSGGDPRMLHGELMMTALLVAEVANAATDRALQTLGGAGWNREEHLLDLLLDARLLRSAPVAEELVRSAVAQHVLGLPRDR